MKQFSKRSQSEIQNDGNYMHSYFTFSLLFIFFFLVKHLQKILSKSDKQFGLSSGYHDNIRCLLWWKTNQHFSQKLIQTQFQYLPPYRPNPSLDFHQIFSTFVSMWMCGNNFFLPTLDNNCYDNHFLEIFHSEVFVFMRVCVGECVVNLLQKLLAVLSFKLSTVLVCGLLNTKLSSHFHKIFRTC